MKSVVVVNCELVAIVRSAEPSSFNEAMVVALSMVTVLAALTVTSALAKRENTASHASPPNAHDIALKLVAPLTEAV